MEGGGGVYSTSEVSIFHAHARQYKRTMARPKGSASLASRLMAGATDDSAVYAEDTDGRQIYLFASWKLAGGGKGALRIAYVGCGLQGRATHYKRDSENPELAQWLKDRWVPRTLLFAKPRRLERHLWLQAQLLEFGCPEGLVVFETPFLKNAFRAEGRLIEVYKELGQARFNQVAGLRAEKIFKPNPNHGSLRAHVPEIRTRLAAGDSVKAIARDFGVDPSSIRCIRNGRSYKNVA